MNAQHEGNPKMHRPAVLESFQYASKSFTSSLPEKVEHALQRSPQLCGFSVTCEQEGDTIFLQGIVPSYYLKQIAQTVASEVDGVDRLVNELDVSRSF